MADLYFNNAVDDNWNELGNWWTDSGFTNQATSLPGSGDSVYIDGQGGGIFVNNSGLSIAVNHFETNGYANISLNQINCNTFSATNCAFVSNITINCSQPIYVFEGCILTDTVTINCPLVFLATDALSLLIINGDVKKMSNFYTGATINGNYHDNFPDSTLMRGTINTQDINLTYSSTGNDKIILVNNSSRLSINGYPLVGMRAIGSGIPSGATLSSLSGNYVTLNCDSNIPQGSGLSVTFKGCAMSNGGANLGGIGDEITINGDAILYNSSLYNAYVSGNIVMSGVERFAEINTFSGGNIKLTNTTLQGGGAGSFIINGDMVGHNITIRDRNYTFNGNVKLYGFSSTEPGDFTFANTVECYDYTAIRNGIYNNGVNMYDYSILDATEDQIELVNDSTSNFYNFSSLTNNGIDQIVFVNFYDNSYVASGVSPYNEQATFVFNDNSYNSGVFTNITEVGSTVTFNGNSYNGGTIDRNVVFNDSSYNDGIVGIDGTFNDSSYNSANGVVSGVESYSNRTPYPIPRGINGSNILGII